MKIRRVICGISRAPESLEAVRQAARLAPANVELRLVSVIEPPVVMPSAGFTGTEWSIPQYDPDMYNAIDLLVDKLDRQLIKHKEKTVARHNGSHARTASH